MKENKRLLRNLAFLGFTLSVLISSTGCTKTTRTEDDQVLTSYEAEETGHTLSQWEDDIYLDVEPIGADAKGKNVVVKTETGYKFSYETDDEQITYFIDTENEKVKNGLIHVTAKLGKYKEIVALTDGGTAYRSAKLTDYTPERFAEEADVVFKPTFEDGVLTLDYYETFEEITTHKSYNIYIKGKTLIYEVSSDSTNYKNGYSQFVLGHAEKIENPRLQTVAYHDDVPVIVVDDSYFLTTFVDLANSNATSKNVSSGVKKKEQIAYTGQNTVYGKNTEGTVNALGERLYITVSSDILECLSYTSNEKTEYRDLITNKVILDVWQSDEEARYSTILPYAETYGMEEVLTIFHRWQRDGYDNSNPVFFPASEVWGGNAALQKTFNALQGYGWMTALHEDYWFIATDKENEYMYEEDLADRLCKSATFQALPGWSNSNTGISGWTILPGAMEYYAEKNSPLIKDTFKTNSCFLDVSGARWPDAARTVTFDASSTMSRSLKQSTKEIAEFFGYLTNMYQGPVFSEGVGGAEVSFQNAMSGVLDGVERELQGHNSGLIMPDYEVKYIRELAAHQGMGYQRRFYTISSTSSSSYPWDIYNSMAIAYGHAGFIQQYEFEQDNILNTYYMFQALQSQYLDTEATVEVAYLDGDKEMTLSEATIAGYDFYKPRLHITYSNGLEIFMNFEDEDWNVTVEGEKYCLDRYGYVAVNQSQDFLQYSCKVNGNRVDYVDCKEYTYANGRGVETNFGDFVTCYHKIVKKNGEKINVKILDISAEATHKTGALIGFDTNVPCYISVYYGEKTPNTLFQTDYQLTTDHNMDLRGMLKAGTTYKYYVVAEDIYGNTVKSDVKTFTTLGKKGDEKGIPYVPALNEEISSLAMFSDIQGDNNWYYYEYNDRTFELLSFDFSTGSWFSKNASFTQVYNSKMHPSETAAVRAYKAPLSGTIKISFSANRADEQGDGVRYSILHNEDIVYPKDAAFVALEPTGKVADTLQIKVKKGDVIYFMVHRADGYSYDSTQDDVKLQYIKLD